MAEHSDIPTHGEPSEGMMCLCTMEDITLEDGNYVEYQSYPSLKWKPALYEKSIVEELLSTQFQQYIDSVKQTDCQAELRRLLDKGPPIYISDKHAMPLDENDDGDAYICQLWFAGTNEYVSSKLQGALEGKEREELWESLKQFIIVDGKENGDDGEKEESN